MIKTTYLFQENPKKILIIYIKIILIDKRTAFPFKINVYTNSNFPKTLAIECHLSIKVSEHLLRNNVGA